MPFGDEDDLSSNVDNTENDSDDNNVCDDDDDDDDNGENRNQDIPLFEGSPLTVKESILSILAVVLRSSLSGVITSAILELITMDCPEPNNCKSALYKFKKYFENLQSSLTRYFYCPSCMSTHVAIKTKVIIS